MASMCGVQFCIVCFSFSYFDASIFKGLVDAVEIVKEDISKKKFLSIKKFED